MCNPLFRPQPDRKKRRTARNPVKQKEMMLSSLKRLLLVAASLQAHVVDRGGSDDRVGDSDERSFRRAQAGGAEADLLDDAFLAADADAVADLERSFANQQKGAEIILERILSGQRGGQAGHAKSSQETAEQIYFANLVDNVDGHKQKHGRLAKAHRHRHDHIREAAVWP